MSSAEILVQEEDQSPAYLALQEAGLITTQYRIGSAAELDAIAGNMVTVASNALRRTIAWVAGVGVGGLVYDAIYKQFSVKAGHVRPAQHVDGSFFFYGPGVHRVMGLFVTVKKERSLQDAKIEHGTRTIVTVPQGFVGLAFDRGQPVLLAPGLHQWESDTMKLQEVIDMSQDVIEIGPYTLITVDEGYAAITQDNGRQKVLNGGATHMLTHRNWKFEKLLSLKIHTDDLGPFRATTADNVVLETSAMVTWRVADPTLAARMAADTMVSEEQEPEVSQKGAHSALRNDVLKQAVASLAATLGSIRYADDVFVAANENVTIVDSTANTKPDLTTLSDQQLLALQDNHRGISEIFSMQQMGTCVRHANEICSLYGVSIISISVNSAIPIDKALEEALSAGAVAAAGAQQAEIAARGNAKARMITVEAEAEAQRISARAEADAERERAQGTKDAAKLLESSVTAVDLAKIEKSAQVLSQKTTFMFGASPAQIPALLANPKFLSDDADDHLEARVPVKREASSERKAEPVV